MGNCEVCGEYTSVYGFMSVDGNEHAMCHKCTENYIQRNFDDFIIEKYGDTDEVSELISEFFVELCYDLDIRRFEFEII